MSGWLVSIIVPVYNEEENVPALYERLAGIAAETGHACEFIFVDDGSVDRSGALLSGLAEKDGRVRVIRLSRNFGSHAACLAGLVDARGDACAVAGADMQEPSDLVPRMLKKWEQGAQVVLGIRRWGTSAGRMLPSLYYGLVRRFALPTMPPGGVDSFLVDRKVRDAVCAMSEKNSSLFGLVLWSGFRQAFVEYEREDRRRGKSKWTAEKKVKLFIDTFVSFSYFPVRLISLLGIVIALLGFGYAGFIVAYRVFADRPVEGWASLMVVLLVVSGIQLVMLGILGEYLWRSFDESRRRPAFIVAERIGIEEPAGRGTGGSPT